jgi:hypothetical protein
MLRLLTAAATLCVRVDQAGDKDQFPNNPGQNHRMVHILASTQPLQQLDLDSQTAILQ